MKNTNKHDHHASEIIYEYPVDTPEKYLQGGKFLFMAYGCAVIERQMPNGMYIYIVSNLSTGSRRIISRRKVQLAKSGYAEMAATLHTSPTRGDGIHTTDKKPGEKVKNNKLPITLKHIFTEILPKHGYAVRDKQIELAEHILAVIKQKGITLAESEVGTGKTHAYLIAAFLAKRGRLNDSWLRGHYSKQSWAESAHMPVVISTSSIALQKAIVTDYIPELSRILMRHGIIKTPLTAVIRKGKEHYICEKRILAYYTTADERTRALLEPFMILLPSFGEDGSIAPLMGAGDSATAKSRRRSGKPVMTANAANAPFDLTGVDSLSPYVKKRICVLEKCEEGCRFYTRCRYANFMKKANDPKIDFQITNHNYFLADTLHRASGRKPLLPNYQLVIMDEAHKFLQAARQMYGLELTDKELPALAQEIHALAAGKSKCGVNTHKLAKKMEETSDKLFQYLNDCIPKDVDDEAERFVAALDGNSSVYLDKIAGILDDLIEALDDRRVQKLNEKRKSKALWRLSMMSDKVSELKRFSKLICWLEKRVEGQTKTDALCVIPKDLDARLHKDLWSNGIPVILTSGTLSASGDFTRVKETLGLGWTPKHKLFDTSMPSPFDYKNNTLLYISDRIPFPDNKDKGYIMAVANEIERLVRASHGHAAVLFTSYNAMGQVHAILRKRNLPFPLFRLERGGVHAIERFKKSDNGILLSSGALWEGIDIPGDTLSMLIIVKLPFAAPDPIGDYERSLCADMATYMLRALIPDMLVKLKQGFGRLIRSEFDTGVVAILDSRVNWRGAYRQCVLAALPECNVTSYFKAVRDFFVNKKSAAYFYKQGRGA